jgi:hypothetical protein
MKKRKRTSLFTPEERALQLARQEELERRVRKGEIELAAHGSPLVRLDRSERLAYSIRQIEAELATKG